MVAAILAPGVFCPHAMTLEVVFRDEIAKDGARLNIPGLAGSERLYVVAILNSYVADSQLRQKITNHLSYFFVYNLPVPRLTEKDPAFAPIVSRAAKLICTTPEFDDLAREVGLGSHANGVTDLAARATLRAELDGLVAHLYGLTDDKFAYILTTFPLVKQPVKDAALEAFRTFQPKPRPRNRRSSPPAKARGSNSSPPPAGTCARTKRTR